MNIFKWEHSLESGIELIDNQHREIIAHVNAFLIAYKCGETHKKTQECLDFLKQYILYHFQSEEAFQVDCDYSGYREHQARHSYLATQVKFHSVNITESDFSLESVTAFYDFINSWIIDHIMTEDMSFARYYKDSRG